MPRHVRSNRREPVRLLATVAVVLSALAGPATLSHGADVDFGVERLTDGIRATSAGKPILEYRSAEEAYKPYVSKLYTPSGVQVLRDSPADHVHHHGLMFALGVNAVNFWEERPGGQALTAIGRQRGGEVQCRPVSEDHSARILILTQALDWVDGEGRALLRERRELTARRERGAKILWLTWNSRLVPAVGQGAVVLNGQRYFGLGMRFIEDMDRGGTFLFADDRSAEPIETNENLIHASWCAYAAKANDQPVTVAMFSDPANRRHPARWFTMREPFAYLSATLGLDQRPLELPAGEVLELSYGVVLADGGLGSDEIQALYDTWARRD